MYYTELASDLSREQQQYVTPSGFRIQGPRVRVSGFICENIFANFKRSIIIHLYICACLYDFLLFCFVYSFQQFHIRVYINKSFSFFPRFRTPQTN
jgi:hypothetical protein